MNEELKEKLRRMVDYYNNAHGADCLKTLRSMINGKLSKRTISPEAQAKMQAARKKKHQET